MNALHPFAAVFLSSAVLIAPNIAAAMGDPDPTPPAQTAHPAPAKNKSQDGSQDKSRGGKSKATRAKSSAAEDFLRGYHAAYALIYDKHDYVAGIAGLHALGYDDNADVATLIGYASRKLGRYADAKFWYERALAADPNHALTWSYYGMWQAERGNLLKAKDDLERVREICGNTACKEYRALKDVIAGTVAY